MKWLRKLLGLCDHEYDYVGSYLSQPGLASMNWVCKNCGKLKETKVIL